MRIFRGGLTKNGAKYAFYKRVRISTVTLGSNHSNSVLVGAVATNEKEAYISVWAMIL